MKRSDISYQQKLDELIFETRHPKNRNRVFILLEGESDVRLFRKCFNMNVCKVEAIPGGNPKLEECTAMLAGRLPRVFGIRDADFLHLQAAHYDQPNMFLTDYHDMEMTLVANPHVFAEVLAEHAPVDDPLGHERARQQEFRAQLMAALEAVSLLKWLNAREDLRLCFSGCGFVDLIRFDDWGFDFAGYFQRVLKKSPDAVIRDMALILPQIEALKALDPHPFHLCNGHDFMQVLASAMRELWKLKGMRDDDMAKCFRLAFNREQWQQTALFRATQTWAQVRQCEIH